MRRSFVFKPLAADLLWQRRLPANADEEPGKTKDADRYQQQAERRAHRHLEHGRRKTLPANDDSRAGS